MAYKNIEVHDGFYIFLTQKRELAARTKLQNEARVFNQKTNEVQKISEATKQLLCP